MSSLGAWLASLPSRRTKAFLKALSDNAQAAAPWMFELWGRVDHQLPPPTTADGDEWWIWVVLGGRGSGKTRAGAEWVRSEVEGARPQDPGRLKRVALVAETADQAREVMVFGPSGLMATTPPDRRPTYEATRRRLVWPNGAEARLFSACDPESLRGPQFDGAWSDELGKWSAAEAAWDMLQLGVRLGARPRQVVTTTPRATPTLLRLLSAPGVATTTAPTSANAAHLAPGFVARMAARYGGGALGRRELEGLLEIDEAGALWTGALVDQARAISPPPLQRVVVAIDPPVTAHRGSDACGLIVAGAGWDAIEGTRRAAVLADLTVQGASPSAWAERAVGAYRDWGADRLVAEVNQGGDLVELVLRQVDPSVAFKAVRATRGKQVRAEPIAALYEQGRVSHAAGLDALEEQMRAMSRRAGLSAGRSPDRVDALVWALTELMLDHRDDDAAPRVRAL